MKNIITKTLLILLLPLTCIGQVGFTGSIGHSEVPVSKFDFSYNIGRHSFIATIQPNLTKQSKYPALTAGLSYGYTVRTWQPYIGYSTQGIVYGVNKYIDNAVIGVGMQGENPVVSIGITTLKVKGKDLFTGNDYAIGILQLISGFSNGLNESLQAGHWGRGKKFWDNSVSWKNKYRDFDNGDTRAAFPGSKNVLVGFTDGYHLTNLISNTANIATLSFAIGGKEKKNWKVIAKKVLIAAAANRAAYYISYNKIFVK